VPLDRVYNYLIWHAGAIALSIESYHHITVHYMK